MLAAVLLLGGCGYVGDPLPPSLKIPVTVSDLAAVERGDKIIIQFTPPAATTDGLILSKPQEVDLRIGSEGLQPWNRETWEAAATQIPVDAAQPQQLVRVETPARPWAGREAIVGARVTGPSGRLSDWSNFVALQVVEPLTIPSRVEGQAVREGVRIAWQPSAQRPERKFRVFRKAPQQDGFVLAGETNEFAWTDRDTLYGATYEYRVQAIVPAGSTVAESELSDAVSITPEDRFAPDVPAGLKALAGLNTIELTWDRVPENEAVYHLYRSVDGGEMIRIGVALQVPSYSDRDITTGKSYSYSVSAMDALGNESAKSTAAVVVAP